MVASIEIHMRRAPKSLITMGACTLLLGAWFIFWALSDSLLNMVRCGNEYSLSANLAECRQPVVFEIIGFLAVGISFFLFFKAWRNI